MKRYNCRFLILKDLYIQEESRYSLFKAGLEFTDQWNANYETLIEKKWLLLLDKQPIKKYRSIDDE